jgi:NAD-dependent SIR2 family protein deacetylase
MVEQQKDMRIPSELVPFCPKCGAPMRMNLRNDNTFVEDYGWHEAASRYVDFADAHKDERLLLLELGVGANTPAIIKYPFWRLTYRHPNTTYVCINFGEAECPKEIEDRAILVNADLAEVLEAL